MHENRIPAHALDMLLPDLKYPAKATLEKAMQGHILARSNLVGLYKRQH